MKIRGIIARHLVGESRVYGAHCEELRDPCHLLRRLVEDVGTL